MDPNATLRSIEANLLDDDHTEAYHLCGDLLDWLRKGGFRPDFAMFPKATAWFVDFLLTKVS